MDEVPSYDESEDEGEGDECPKHLSSEENDYEEERDEELNELRLNEEGDDNDFEPHWDLVVQHFASLGEEAPVNNDVEASIEWTGRILRLMENPAFMEMLQVEAAGGGLGGANEPVE